MSDQTEATLKLIALLDEHRDELADSWRDAMRQEMPDALYSQSSSEEIRTNNLIGLSMLRDLLQGRAPDTIWERRQPLALTSHYLNLGQDISEVLMLILLLEDVVLALVRRASASDPAEARQVGIELRRHVHLLARSSVRGYAEMASQLLRKEQDRTALMLEMARTVGRSLDLDKVLRRVTDGIAAAVGAQHCILYMIGDHDQNGRMWAATDKLPPRSVESLQDSMRRLPLSDTSLIRLAVEAKEPQACYDAQTDPRAAREAARAVGIRSFLAVPCLLRDQVVGVALVLTYDEPRAFTEEQIELAQGIANTVAPAIENARLHQRVEQLAVLEERSRLAREIHDDVAQVLGTLQLRMGLLDNLLSNNKVAEARDSLPEVQDLVSKAYSELRESVFDLRATAFPGETFLPALREYLADYRQHYELDVSLEAPDDAVARLDGSTGVQVIRIIQEALTNARRHAQASRAWVRIYWLEDCLFVSVEDDGQGFDSSDPLPEDRPHFGLQVMRERAEKVGGHLNIRSRPGGGTRILLRLPG